MKLIIVESPHKATTIQNYLGKSEYKVEASKGHVCDLPARNLGIDIEHDFEPQYVITPEKQKTIDMLIREVKSKKYDKIYLATDPDREGEAISWHLKNCLGLKEDKIRIEFTNVGSGLEVRNGKLGSFAIAGKDGKFVWANAELDGNSVLVWAESVKEPTDVRYAWAGYPLDANLYNKEGFPASPFRTDVPDYLVK